MNIEEFRQAMLKQEYVDSESGLLQMFHKLAQEALKITAKINNEYHTSEKLRELFSELIGKNVPDSFYFRHFILNAVKILQLVKMSL